MDNPLGLKLNTEVRPFDAILFEDDSAYYGDRDYMTNSRFGNMLDNVHDFYAHLKGEYEYSTEEQVFVFGRFVHVLSLEAEKAGMFNMVDVKSRRTNKFEEAKAEFGFDWVLTRPEFYQGKNMSDSFLKADGIKELLAVSENEKAYVGLDPFGFNVPIKGKVDIYTPKHPDNGAVVIGDIKTTGKSIDDFVYSIKTFNYDRQAAMYMSLTGADEFHFYPITKKGGHAVAKYIVERDSKTFSNGMYKFEAAVSKYHRLFVEGKYSPTHLHEVKLP